MPYNERSKPYISYYNAMHRSNTRLFCPHCNTPMLPKHFEKHCFQLHNIDSKTSCVWCQRVSWPEGEKIKNGNHLSICYKNFMRNRSINRTVDPSTSLSRDGNINMEPSNSSYRLLNMTHSFPEKDFFGHQMSHPMFLEEFLNTPIQPLPSELLPPLPITFTDNNLNLAASCVLFYLKGTHDFFHLMIKLPALDSFQEALSEDQGRSCTLPFSCWCDGGSYREAHYRQHRHMIVSSPKNHFQENVWRKIKLPPGTHKPKPNYPCKKLKRIISPLHLVNTIGYVSQRKSRCNFSFLKRKKNPMRNNHFYLYKTLPVDFKLHLVLLWNGGVSQLLYQTKFQNVSVARLALGDLTFDGRRWTQKIKDFYGHERGLVVCVAREYVPCNRITPHFLHLAEGRKLYFSRSAENRNMHPELWLRKQYEGGNRFYDAVEECLWIPRQRDQKILNFHKPLVRENRQLVLKVAEQARKIRVLESQMEAMRLEMDNLKNQIIQYKDEEIDRLKQEISRLQNYIWSNNM